MKSFALPCTHGSTVGLKYLVLKQNKTIHVYELHPHPTDITKFVSGDAQIFTITGLIETVVCSSSTNPEDTNDEHHGSMLFRIQKPAHVNQKGHFWYVHVSKSGIRLFGVANPIVTFKQHRITIPTDTEPNFSVYDWARTSNGDTIIFGEQFRVVRNTHKNMKRLSHDLTNRVPVDYGHPLKIAAISIA